MEQWLVNNSCCDITSFNKNKHIYRQMNTNEYIANNLNSLSLSYRYTIARILVVRMYEPIQRHNGCYILFDNLDKDTINEICNFLKTKLIPGFDLFTFCSLLFIQYI